MLHPPSSQPSRCSHQPAKRRRMSPHSSWHPGESGKPAVWGVQGADRNKGHPESRSIYCPENLGSMEHQGSDGLEDISRHLGPEDTEDLGQYLRASRTQGGSSTQHHPGSRGHPVPGRNSLGTEHPAASRTPGENLGPCLASGACGYLRSRPGWASHSQQYPHTKASHTRSIPYREHRPRAATRWLPGITGSRTPGSTSGLG